MKHEKMKNEMKEEENERIQGISRRAYVLFRDETTVLRATWRVALSRINKDERELCSLYADGAFIRSVKANNRPQLCSEFDKAKQEK